MTGRIGPESPLLDIARIICPLATVLHIQLYSAAGLLAAGCWLPAAGCLAINDSDLDWAWWRGFGGKLPGGGGRGLVVSQALLCCWVLALTANSKRELAPVCSMDS